mmetsp:Transcript_51947/g.121631  ORF Transcript_51947/g.121631 Transcript_51947/m.121631 type:complete len:230 (+) Transcript_51947:1049-1738(+)
MHPGLRKVRLEQIQMAQQVMVKLLLLQVKRRLRQIEAKAVIQERLALPESHDGVGPDLDDNVPGREGEVDQGEGVDLGCENAACRAGGGASLDSPVADDLLDPGEAVVVGLHGTMLEVLQLNSAVTSSVASAPEGTAAGSLMPSVTLVLLLLLQLRRRSCAVTSSVVCAHAGIAAGFLTLRAVQPKVKLHHQREREEKERAKERAKVTKARKVRKARNAKVIGLAQVAA